MGRESYGQGRERCVLVNVERFRGTGGTPDTPVWGPKQGLQCVLSHCSVSPAPKSGILQAVGASVSAFADLLEALISCR